MRFTFVTTEGNEISEKEESLLKKKLEASGSPLAQKEFLTVHPRDDYLLFEFEDGFSFYRKAAQHQRPVDIFLHYLRNPVIHRYMPVTYELTSAGDQETAKKLLENFQEKYGWRVANHIDWMQAEITENRHVVMMLLPQELVETMMRPQGGILYTEIRGPAASLRRLPSVKPLIPDTVHDDESVRRMFATRYEANQYNQALQYHNQVMQEVCREPGHGISICKFAAWNP